jgi:hypothetical protein
MAFVDPESTGFAVLRGIHDTGIEGRAMEFGYTMAGPTDCAPIALPKVPTIIGACSSVNHITAVDVMVGCCPRERG